MSKELFTANAKVTMSVEITIRQGWAATSAVDQVFEQASKEAVIAVQRLMEGKARIIGEPKVTVIMAAQERD